MMSYLKKTWRNKSTYRRDLYKFELGSKSPTNMLFAKRGVDFPIRMQMLDETGSYPLNLDIKFNTIPEGWWAPKPNEMKISGDLFELISEDE